MKVLWFTLNPLPEIHNNHKNIGGGWVNALEQSLTQIDSVELAICCKSKILDIQKKIIKKTTYYVIPYGNNSKPNLINKKNISYYKKVLEDFKPDIIQIFGTENDYGHVITETKTPVVIHLQGILSVYNQKYFNNINKFDLIHFSKIKDILKGESLLRKFRMLEKSAERERHIFKTCRYYMGRTNWDHRITNVLSPEGNYFHCEEAIRPEFFNAQWSQQNRNKRIFTSIIRGNLYKGLDTVIEVCQLLQNLNVQFEWQIAGIESNDTISKIYAKKYRINYNALNIRFLGKKNAGDIINLLVNSDIFIHPSHIENSPNSICEAMTLGMPIIATFVGGSGDILENGKEGILVQDGDPYAMTGAIIDMLKNVKDQEKFGNNARKRAMERHNVTKITATLLNIYNQIIESNK